MAMAVVGIFIASGFLTMLPFVTLAQEIDACKNYGTNANVTFTPAWNNPFYTALNCEPTMIFNSSAGWIDEWFASGLTYGGGNFNQLWYTHTTNSNFTTHTTPVIVLNSVRFPFVVRDNSTGIFYCFGHQVIQDTWTFPVYMWTSHNKMNWTLANGGKPVLYNSLDGDSIYNWIANPTVVIIGGVFHLWIECADDSIISDTHGFGIAYSYSAVSTSVNFTHNATANQVIYYGGSPNAQYVPGRNAVMVFWHKHSGNPFASVAKIVISTIYMSSNERLSSSYTESDAVSIGIWNQYTADFTMAVTNHSLVMQFFHNQPYVEDIYQMNCSLTLNQFFDQVSQSPIPTIPLLPDNVHQYVVLILVFFSLVLVMPVVGLVQQSREKSISHDNVIEIVVFEVIGLILLGFLVVFLGS
jgi:hypothetical protein